MGSHDFLPALESASLAGCSDLHVAARCVRRRRQHRGEPLSVPVPGAPGSTGPDGEMNHQAGRVAFARAPVCLSDEVVTGTDNRI